MKLHMQVGLDPGHIVFDGDQAPQFSAHACGGQMAGWIKMLLGMQVDLSPSHIVLDGDPAPLPKKGSEPSPMFCPCLWPNGYMDPDATWLAAGVVASVIRRMNEVTLPRARLVLGWVTVFGIPSRCVKGQLSLASLRGR